MAPHAQLEREIASLTRTPESSESRPQGAPGSSRSRGPRTGWDLTDALARTMPRFEFIAHWLAIVTRKKENRGPLGLYVRRRGKRWQIVSPVGGGVVVYETADPSLLFDYARRTQLGPHVRDAEEFRGLAYQQA